MKIAVLGTGEVGTTLASALLALGHEVRLGSRTADNPAAREWASGSGGSAATFADAARGADVLVNATAGVHSAAALACVDPADLAGKVLLDVANPIVFSGGAPALSVSGTDSLAEQLQRAHPDLRIVKTLNTINSAVMVDPASVPGEHVVFLSGDDPAAKATARELLHGLGWPEQRVVDLGGLRSARGTEGYLLLWVALWQATGTGLLNVELRTAAT